MRVGLVRPCCASGARNDSIKRVFAAPLYVKALLVKGSRNSDFNFIFHDGKSVYTSIYTQGCFMG